MKEQIEKLQHAIQNSNNIVFFGGAGVSTESGIPDFRSADGIFMQETGIEHSPEEVISHPFFKQFPALFFKFHFEKLVHTEAMPNACHLFLAELESQKNVTVITQNIDALHQKAGSRNVLELHGNVVRNYCVDCGKQYDIEQLVKDEEGIPRCTDCNGIVRPDIVLYGETLNSDVVQQAVQAIQQADYLIVAGTSLVVYPAAGFVDLFKGEHLAVINKTPLREIRSDALVIEGVVGEVFSRLDI